MGIAISMKYGNRRYVDYSEMDKAVVDVLELVEDCVDWCCARCEYELEHSGLWNMEERAYRELRRMIVPDEERLRAEEVNIL
jgi:hypothetical protein